MKIQFGEVTPLSAGTGRIQWVDVLKGYAIVLVMLGHTEIAAPVSAWIYSFHIPLFFFLSGYVFSVKKYANLSEFFRAKAKSLLLPVLTFGIVIKLFELALNPSWGILNLIKETALGLVLELRGKYDMGMWFLVCLFVVQIAYWFILKITKGNAIMQILILVLAGGLGILYLHTVNKIFPWCFDAALFAVGFFGGGYLVRNYKKEWISHISKASIAVISFIVNIIAVIVSYRFNCVPDLYADIIGNPLLYYAGSVSGIICSISLVNLVRYDFPILLYIGKNSLTYYGLHKAVFFSGFDALLVLIGFQVTAFWTRQLKSVLYVVIACLGMAVIAQFINRYAPWFAGKKRINDDDRKRKQKGTV